MTIGLSALHILAIVLASCAANWGITFFARTFALKFGAIVSPAGRRRHPTPTPLLGGVGYYLILSLAIGALLLGSHPDVTSTYLVALFCAATLVFGTGMVDDFRELKAPPKLLGQLIAAALVVSHEENLPQLFAKFGVSSGLGYLLAVAWIIGVTNALNLIDGLDGLCSGVVALAALSLGLINPIGGTASTLGFVIAGSALGFLFHNKNPAKIFLGDSGSLLLGFALSVLSLRHQTPSRVLSLFVPIFIFGLPLLDTTLAIFRRLRQSRSILKGDRGHLHHRLLYLGLSPGKTTFALLALAAYANSTAYCLSNTQPIYAIYVLMLSLPAVSVFMAALKYTENGLSSRMSRFGHLFLEEDLHLVDDPGKVNVTMVELIKSSEKSGLPFSVVVLDCSSYLKELLNERPAHLIGFYNTLYGILKNRLRETDYIYRPSELQFAVVLPETWDYAGKHAAIFDFLRNKLMELQNAYRVYHGDPHQPEGFRILIYPRDKAKILEVFKDSFRSRALLINAESERTAA